MIELPLHPLDFLERREQVLPLPTLAKGYARVLFVGTTGSGKTTLMREFLGINPTTENFPPASGGKTTTADIEFVLTPGPYKAVVTFLSQEVVLTYVRECLLAAAQAYYKQEDPKAVAGALLEHAEQRFRLRYILGQSPLLLRRDASIEEQQFAAIIQSYQNAICALVDTVRASIEDELDHLEADVSDEDHDIHAQYQLEQLLVTKYSFQALINSIIAAIQQRFQRLPSGGKLEVDDNQWPLSWSFETPGRQDFLRTIHLFSSNHYTSFGKLLTPLVQGFRVAGPFRPWWRPDLAPRLVLIDGEGLGHTPKTVDNLSPYTTSLFEKVDAIVLVDHAKSPMQAGAQAILETVVASGYASKLFISFTHFDEVHGDNFADRQAREEHVKNSLDQTLLDIGIKFGQRNKQTLKRSLEGRVFFLSFPPPSHSTKQRDDQVPSEEIIETQGELRRMLEAIETIEVPPPPDGLQPTYNENRLFSFIIKAFQAFRARWRALMAISSSPEVRPEHWTRIQALSSRVYKWSQEEYQNLKPVADLMRETTEQVRKFLEQPVRWTPPDYGSEEMRQAAIDQIAREFYQRLYNFVRSRMIITPRADWTTAYRRSGPGQAKVRARDIDAIYSTVAPTFTDVGKRLDAQDPPPSTATQDIMEENWNGDDSILQLTTLVKEAILAGGGRIIRQ